MNIMMTIKYNVVHGGYPRMYSYPRMDYLDNYNNIQVRYANICIEEVKADRIMEVGGLTYYYKGGYCQGTIETNKIISITNH